MSAAEDAARAIERRRDRLERKRRRRGRRRVGVVLWFVVMVVACRGVRTWFFVGWLQIGGFLVWDAKESADSVDGRLRAIAQQGNEGALGWGPRRVVLAPIDDPSEVTVVFQAPDRRFPLEPRWTGARELEITVHGAREATLAELAASRFVVAVGGENVDVRLAWKEWGDP